MSAAHWRGRPLKAVLFDLDGTLADTAADITASLNFTIRSEGWDPFPVADVSRMIGRGSPMLIERAAQARGVGIDAATQARLLATFLDHYATQEERHEDTAQAYEGAADTLRKVHSAGVAIAVVTNKQRDLAVALLERLELAPWIDLVIGGDTCERRKPDPQPLLHACYVLHSDVGHALMVGDSINDVTAAHAAQIPIVCVTYGYNEGRDPKTLDCEALLDSLTELPALLLRPAP